MSTETLRELQAELKLVYETKPLDKEYRNSLLGAIEDEYILIERWEQARARACEDMTGQDLDEFYSNDY